MRTTKLLLVGPGHTLACTVCGGDPRILCRSCREKASERSTWNTHSSLIRRLLPPAVAVVAPAPAVHHPSRD